MQHPSTGQLTLSGPADRLLLDTPAGPDLDVVENFEADGAAPGQALGGQAKADLMTRSAGHDRSAAFAELVGTSSCSRLETMAAPILVTKVGEQHFESGCRLHRIVPMMRAMMAATPIINISFCRPFKRSKASRRLVQGLVAAVTLQWSRSLLPSKIARPPQVPKGRIIKRSQIFLEVSTISRAKLRRIS